MTKNVAVGFDGSQSSEEAVRWAADHAQSCGASLRIITCFQVPVTSAALVGYGYGDALNSIEEATRQQVKRIAEGTIVSHPGLPVTWEVSPGPPALVLVDGLESDDLVVVGSSRHEHAAAFWLGSTPRTLIRHSPCPVAVVRGAATRGRPERIVVGIDGSAAALEALDWAGDEADRQHAQLLIVHGWTYPYIEIDSSAGQARDLTKVDAACTLDKSFEHAVERFATVPTPCLVEASAPSALLATVRDGDLLVLGSRGRGALTSAIFGSTVNTVLEQAAVPVVVVHVEDERS